VPELKERSLKVASLLIHWAYTVMSAVTAVAAVNSLPLPFAFVFQPAKV